MQATRDIRVISDIFAADGNADNSFGLTNMVWGVGQFLGAPSLPPAHACTTCMFQHCVSTIEHGMIIRAAA